LGRPLVFPALGKCVGTLSQPVTLLCGGVAPFAAVAAPSPVSVTALRLDPVVPSVAALRRQDVEVAAGDGCGALRRFPESSGVSVPALDGVGTHAMDGAARMRVPVPPCRRRGQR